MDTTIYNSYFRFNLIITGSKMFNVMGALERFVLIC